METTPEHSAARHPHAPPRLPTGRPSTPRVLVVGGGHAGVEAALAAARLGARVQLLSFRLDRIAEMSCNPAIGGLGKGQIVREIDALGGIMGRVADETGIQFRMLGTGKGAAVRGPRCQSDRHRYRAAATAAVGAHPAIELVQGAATGLLVNSDGPAPVVQGVCLQDGRELRAEATVLTTGTFLRAVMHTGEARLSGGRVGEESAEGLSQDSERLGLALGRLKTGTPPRLAAEGIAWERLERQVGDAAPHPFSFATDVRNFPCLPQIDCHLTATNPRTHRIIRENVHRAPMYSGRIQGVGPRYCPSVEDKIMRFADKQQHPVYLEPEGLDTEVVYVNGVSTSLPAEVQEEFVRTIEGLEAARFLRHGYAVEYDFVQPFQLADTLAMRRVPGLFLAGQINGTSGYEEAAGQGLIAGANAALWSSGREPFVLGRDEAYIGVMVDDLIISNPSEPYRMFSSRAEFRLILRQDNADRRLVRRASAIGLQDEAALERLERKEARLAQGRSLLASLRDADGRLLLEVLRRPEARLADLERRWSELSALALDDELRESLEVDVKYEGYVARQREEVERMRRRESVEIPGDLDYARIPGLAGEAREKLEQLRPRTLGAAGRIAGVRPPDVALLSIQVERVRRGAVGRSL